MKAARVRPTAINKIVFVEANLTNTSAKFQLYSPYGFWRSDDLMEI